MAKQPIDGKPKHRGNTAGLKPPWRKGQCGNPKGHGPGAPKQARTFTELCHTYGADLVNPETGLTRIEDLRNRIWGNAEEGDTKAAALILDRIDPALKKVELTGVVADVGNQMLDRLLQSTVLPVVTQISATRLVPLLGTNGHANGNGNGH